MDYDFLSNHRSKMACMKQTLQMMLLLLVCVWFLYQIKQSSRANRTEGFGGEIRVFEEYKIVLLGRKVIPSSWLNQIPLPADQKVQENHEQYSENNVQINETERSFFRFHDENGFPPEDYETEPHETVLFSGDANDVEGNSESAVTHSDTSGISAEYSSVL